MSEDLINCQNGNYCGNTERSVKLLPVLGALFDYLCHLPPLHHGLLIGDR